MKITVITMEPTSVRYDAVEKLNWNRNTHPYDFLVRDRTHGCTPTGLGDPTIELVAAKIHENVRLDYNNQPHSTFCRDTTEM